MSAGQRPRWPAYFPRMKRRGRHRNKPPRIVLYDQHWAPIWPPVLAGVDIRGGTVTFTTGGVTRRLSGKFWHTVPTEETR